MIEFGRLGLYLLAMFVLVFCIKALPMVFCKKQITNNFLKSFLEYVPVAVLTSMTIPEVFNSTGNVWSAWVGVIVAAVLAYFNQGLLVVSLSAVGAVFIAEQLINFIK